VVRVSLALISLFMDIPGVLPLIFPTSGIRADGLSL